MGNFESPAASRFITSAEEVAQLLDIHEQISGTERGRRDLEVLNKSAIVLLCAVWEAFCEDLADQALHHLLEHSRDYSALPMALQKRVAKELKDDQHELSPWRLAGDGWKAHLHARLTVLRARRDFDWNNPRSSNVDKLFEDVVGISNVSNAWHWKHVSVQTARHKLDEVVALRGAIAHRGGQAQYVKKFRVTRALNHVSLLMAATDARVTFDLDTITGVTPWSSA